MDAENSVCPVCTLYLRPGITLESHLKSHPKQKVIEALVRLSHNDSVPKEPSPESSQSIVNTQSTTETPQPWTSNMGLNSMAGNFPGVPGNHSIIYHQIMSSTSQQPSVLNVNPMNQQYVTIPTVFNPQMMCPYVFQQQQQVIIHRPLLELPDAKSNSQLSPNSSIYSVNSPPNIVEHIDQDQEIDKDSEEKEEKLSNYGGDDDNNADEVEERKYDTSEETDCDKEFDDKIEIHEECLDTQNDNKIIKEDNKNEVSNDDSFETTDSNYEVNEEQDKMDLNKACQTQNQMPNSNQEIEKVAVYADGEEDEEGKPSYLESCSQTNYVTIENNYSHSSKVTYNQPPENIQQTTEVNFIEMDGMNLVLGNDFVGPQVISQVEDYEFAQNRSERPKILMTIGSMDGHGEVYMETAEDRQSDFVIQDNEIPVQSTSSDENNGATWNRVQYQEGSSGMSTSYDLIARETWEGSDGSDNELPPLQSRLPQHVHYDDASEDDPPKAPSISEFDNRFYKCSSCDEIFPCPKELDLHQIEAHKRTNEVGSRLGKKKVKKLVIKPKKTVEIKTEGFDFSSQVKEETQDDDSEENQDELLEPIKNTNYPSDVPDVKNEARDEPSLCGLCELILPNMKALKEHKLEVHKLGAAIKYRCGTCDAVFTTEPKYAQHLKIHPLECKLCGKLFYRRQSMQLHTKRHLGIKPYKCTICDKSFLTKQKHDEHKNIHTGETPIKCNMCDESFRRHSNLIQHRNRHHLNVKKKVKDFVCHCGEVFHSKKKLAWHKEIHDTKPKACPHCSEKFIHASSLSRHIRRAHNERYTSQEENNKKNVECPICKGLYLKSSLETHLKCHSGVRPFTCLICNKDFTTKWNLKLHKWTHASRTLKPFKCELCKGAFVREADYTAHMNSHKSVRPYTCNYCGAQFIRKYNCQRHVKEHEKKKTFTCTVCNKQFHRSYYLNDHMRVHSGERPFACHICGKTSTTKSNHNKHVRIHHAREPVSTEN